MRILHCSDIHADDASYRWLVVESRRYDLVCLAGDMLDMTPHRLPAGQIERVVGYLRQIKVPLAICSGNHDNFYGDDPRLINAAWLRELRRLNLWIDGDAFLLGGHRFRIFRWMDTVPPSAAADEIWLMHAPPDLTGTSVVRGGVDFGDYALGELCRSGHGPRLVLSGHVHERLTWCAKVGRTWTLNPGRPDSVRTPNHISIEISHSIFATFATTPGGTEANAVQRLE